MSQCYFPSVFLVLLVLMFSYLWTGRQTDRQSKYDLQNGMTHNNLVVNHANTKLLQFTEKTLHPTKPDS